MQTVELPTGLTVPVRSLKTQAMGGKQLERPQKETLLANGRDARLHQTLELPVGDLRRYERMHLRAGRASWRAAEIRKLLLPWEATCGAASCRWLMARAIVSRRERQNQNTQVSRMATALVHSCAVLLILDFISDDSRKCRQLGTWRKSKPHQPHLMHNEHSNFPATIISLSQHPAAYRHGMQLGFTPSSIAAEVA